MVRYTKEQLNERIPSKLLKVARTARNARQRLRKGLDNLPTWADDYRLVLLNERASGQLRHAATGMWLSDRKGLRDTVSRNLSSGAWVYYTETDHTLIYTCRHGYTGERGRQDACKKPQLIGSCPECLSDFQGDSFRGSLGDRRRRWEDGRAFPEAPCYLYLLRLSDGSYIYGVSAAYRISSRLSAYRHALGYTPHVVHKSLTTERVAWIAEDVIKRQTTRGLKGGCEASRTEGGMTEYLTADYSDEEAIRTLNEAAKNKLN